MKFFLLLLISSAAYANPPIIWSGTSAQMLPSSLRSVGVCTFSASGILASVAPGTSGNVLTSNGSAWISQTPASGGTVTSVSVVSTNGFAGTVATATTTPAITLSTTITGILKGNGTAISAATSGTDYSAGTSGLTTGILKSTTTTGALTIAVAGDFPALPYASSTLTSAHLFVGNGSNVATDTALSGDIAITNAGVSSYAGTVPVNKGGTSLTTLTANNVILGNGTSAPNFVAPGTSGNALLSNGTTWTSAAIAFTNITGVATVAQTTVATQALTTCSTARTIDWSTGNEFTVTLTNGNACAFTFSNATSGQTITLDIYQPSTGGGTATATWATTTLWAGGTAPTITVGNSKTDTCTIKYNGTDYRGSCVQDLR